VPAQPRVDFVLCGLCSSQADVAKPDLMDVLRGMELMTAARRELHPALAGGNRTCGGRLR
jgi:hypothetical protein